MKRSRDYDGREDEEVIDLAADDEGQEDDKELNKKVESLFSVVRGNNGNMLQCRCCDWEMSLNTASSTKRKVHLLGREVNKSTCPSCLKSKQIAHLF